MPRLSLGERLNNPGCIVYSSRNQWTGLEGREGRFAKFREPVFGIRALGKLLLNYQRFYNRNTIEQIISRWAPPNENDTEAYIESVVQHSGFGRLEELELENIETLLRLTKAVINHENGRVLYEDELINTALRSALGHEEIKRCPTCGQQLGAENAKEIRRVPSGRWTRADEEDEREEISSRVLPRGEGVLWARQNQKEEEPLDDE